MGDVLREFHEGVGGVLIEGRRPPRWARLTGDGLVVYLNDPLTVQRARPGERVGLAVAMREFLWGAWPPGGDAAATRCRSRPEWALGYATVGRMGLEGRWEYGPVGPVVHLAEQLAATARPRQVLVSAALPCPGRRRGWGGRAGQRTCSSRAWPRAGLRRWPCSRVQGGLRAPGELAQGARGAAGWWPTASRTGRSPNARESARRRRFAMCPTSS